MAEIPYPPPMWPRDIAEAWADDALRLAFHPATPAPLREHLMRYVQGVEQQFRLADRLIAGG